VIWLARARGASWAKAPAFDMMLGIMVGSIVSRAITGNAPLVPALAATATLIALHSVLTAVTCRWHGFGEMIKGRPRVIVRGGHKDEAAIRIAHLTDRDLGGSPPWNDEH
jgi:uncharacterized membrane protein YcaP (DUF421 family)